MGGWLVKNIGKITNQPLPIPADDHNAVAAMVYGASLGRAQAEPASSGASLHRALRLIKI